VVHDQPRSKGGAIPRWLCALSIFATVTPCMPAAELAPPPLANAVSRREVSLDGAWRTIVDPYGHGGVDYRAQPRADGYFRDARPPQEVRARESG